MKLINRLTIQKQSNKGFTITELVVVVVVIAILASIVIVGYGAVRKQAIESSMSSDLQAAQTQLALLKGASKNYPITAEAANNGQGLKTSNGNSLLYIGGTTNFCLVAKNPDITDPLYLSGTTRLPTAGSCGPFVGTVAGTGAQYSGAGYADGTGSVARFNSPQGIAISNSDVMYIADQGNRRIRMMTTAGVVTTYAGTGVAGNTNGPAATAQFGSPNSVTVDASGNVYVSDSTYHNIRKITPGGTVSTLAGSGSSGYTDATGLAAQFNSPGGLVADSSGNVYVADRSNHRIRKITPGGVVTTLAGSGTSAHTDGTGVAAAFASPADITIDTSGNLFVVSNNSVRKVTQAGVVTTVAGVIGSGSIDGNASTARFDWPTGIAINNTTGNLYVVDKSSGQIRKVTQSGDVTTIAGTIYTWDGIDGPGASAAFAWPDEIAISSNGTLYIADSDNDKIRMMIE